MELTLSAEDRRKINEMMYTAAEEDNIPMLNEEIGAGADTEYKIRRN